MRKCLLAVCCACLIASAIQADDWPQFRGPDRSGVSKEKGLLKAWPKGGPALAWTFKDAGLGFSSVAVVKGVVYTLGTDAKFDDEYVIAIDEKSGVEKWRKKIGPLFTFPQNEWGDGPRSTPTVDGNLLYALGGGGQLVCIDVAQKGKEIWRKHLEKDLGGVMMTKWGYSESPLVDGDLLVCTPGGKQGTLAALDKKTGAVKWRSVKWTEAATYSSIVAADINGVRQYVQNGYTGANGGGSVAGVDAKTGNLLWSHKIVPGDSYAISPTPIVKGNLVYVTSSDECHLVEIGPGGPSEKYKKLMQKKLKNRDGGVVLIGDFIYGHSDPGMWVCQDFKTGKHAWSERDSVNCPSGSITAADGMLYLYTDEGEAALLEATPEKFNLVSKFVIPQKSKISAPGGRKTSRSAKTWAHPVIANGHLYLRDTEFIFAFKITK